VLKKCIGISSLKVESPLYYHGFDENMLNRRTCCAPGRPCATIRDVKRRNFLYSLGAGVTAISAQNRREASAPAIAPDSPIGLLKSRKGEAVPISGEERKARMEQAQKLMREAKIDAICLAGGSSLEYFSGVHWGNSERMFLMVISGKGDPFFVTPAFEEDRAREQIANGPWGSQPHVYTWNEDESPSTLTAAGLKEWGISSGRLGIEEKTPYVFAEALGKAAPALKIDSATAITAGCRMIKSKHEVALMRLGAEVTVEAYHAAWQMIHEGMTQHEFGGLISAAHQKLGFPGGGGPQVGEYSALPHGSVTPQQIRQGTIVLVDGGCSVEGYASDITRTFVLGKPTDKMKRVFDIVHQAQTKAVQTARPGLPCEAVDAAARKVIVDAGFGPGYKYFGHRLGHGMGLDGHEWPYLVKGNKLPLVADMTFSDEPGIYIKGEFGVRLEDDMHITDNGAELFTKQSVSLEQPFG
jgi:Xaa-Pro dipeptidase